MHFNDIVTAVDNKDLEFAKTLLGLYDHHSEIKKTFQTNCIEFMEKTTNRIYCRFYMRNNNKWEFYDYGWLVMSETDLGEDYRIIDFFTGKSKLNLYSQLINISTNTLIVRHDNSLTHYLISDDKNQYLLFNPYPQVITRLFKILRSE